MKVHFGDTYVICEFYLVATEKGPVILEGEIRESDGYGIIRLGEEGSEDKIIVYVAPTFPEACGWAREHENDLLALYNEKRRSDSGE